MPLIRRRRVSLSLKHMAQMPSTIATHNLSPFHTKCPICMSRNRSGHGIKICRPATARFEFGVCLVERRIAGSAIVDACGGVVRIEFTGAGGFGAFLTDDSELF